MKKRPLLWFFIMTYVITWGLVAVYFLFPHSIGHIAGEMSVTNPVFILAVWGPTFAAMIVSWISSGRGSVIELLKSFIPARTGIIWYLLVIFLIPVFGILIHLVTNTPFKIHSMSTHEFLTLALVLIITGPLGEELGWRGFALPRLLRRHSAFIASLVVGIIWGVWHLPSFFTPGLPQAGLQIPLFLITAIAIAIICTWIYLHTGRRIFHCVLLHLSVNITAMFVGLELKYMTLMQVCFAGLLLLRYGWHLGAKE